MHYYSKPVVSISLLESYLALPLPKVYTFGLSVPKQYATVAIPPKSLRGSLETADPSSEISACGNLECYYSKVETNPNEYSSNRIYPVPNQIVYSIDVR